MSEKHPFPTCSILGVNIAVTNMKKTIAWLEADISKLSGSYICISNVHTTVTAYEEESYRAVQNGAAAALPGGEALAGGGRERGVGGGGGGGGPDLMGEIFRISARHGWRHYFYGSTEETLTALREALERTYPGIAIAGMYSPPFRPLTAEEDRENIERINRAQADFVWIGLGAPKQERWMAAHEGKVQGLMIGVGAGFDYHAGRLKRAPQWMQKCSLEWLYRLLQDPVRLFKRYLLTNTKYLWLVSRENRRNR